jgi:hypothetical protein
MKKALLFFSFFLSAAYCLAQELPSAYRAYVEKYPEGPALNHQDSIYLMNIPEKTMPANLRSDPLPPFVDNSTLPYLRPVFQQQAPSCGQAAMVGYNFTYEMAYRRDQPAIFPQTQYPTHFTYNFQNGGNGWYGVSYFHSIEILRLCGCMNSYDYGDYYDDAIRWINGYDLYYNGMYNRVKGVYGIHTGTEEGLLTLKHWLYDHMGEGNYGGVASYYANVPWNAQLLNDTTPEGGKNVVTEWFPVASHAMTIVGYNDSIRWDYNGDGIYSNHIDLNGDGVMDPRDWEIGAVKFVNSHGIEVQDSGFCYMMYKCLAETFENGGVWNQEVHILDIDENYQPLITYKVTLKHNFREKVKVLAGLSQDTADYAPAWLMEFPIIDNQGADHYMQGQDTAEYLKYLEFGLDITPLLSNLQPGEPAKFFFIVDENDPGNAGEGEITSFSVMDYTSGQQEIISTETPLMLDNNSRTMVSVMHIPDFDIVEITTDTLPIFTINEPYGCQLAAGGGTTPYLWDAKYNYRLEQSTETLPEVNAIQVLYTSETDTIMPVPLGFSFPFYGELYDTVYMHISGHLQLDNSQIPWPYLQEPELLFQSFRIIAPMTSVAFTIIPADDDGGWAETNDTSATFRWKLSWSELPGTTDLNFAVRIDHNGKIEFIFGTSTPVEASWLSGISAGNHKDFIYSPVSGSDINTPGKKISFIYNPLPNQLEFSENGLLSGNFDTDDIIYDVSLRVMDQSGLSATKTLQLTSGPYLYFTVYAGGDDRLDFGDTARLDLQIRNGSAYTLWNCELELITEDPFIEIVDPVCLPGTLLPGQDVTIPEAFNFIVSADVPDQRDLLLHAILTTDARDWYKDLIFKANAPGMKLSQVIDDGENGKLDPGETAPLTITLHNTGHAALSGVMAELFPLDEEVVILNDPVQDYGTIGKGASVARDYLLHAEDSTPEGFIVHFILMIASQSGWQYQDSIEFMIGRSPVLVIDMDPNNHSGPVIIQQLNELNVISEYDYSVSQKIADYKSLFICLGYQNSNHVLTLWEGQKLADYLDDGGRIYMEGRKTWKDDPGTPVHPRFNLQWAGSPTVFDTITGIEGTFTQGLEMLNESFAPFSYYHIEPLEPAFAILQDNNNLKPCAIAHDAGIYKTVGGLFEFGTLSDISPDATRDLMVKYLEFFDIEINPNGVAEEPEEAFRLQVYPNPASRQLAVGSRQSAVGSWQSAVGGRRPVLKAESEGSAVRLVIIDLFGRQLKDFGNISSFPFMIDISDLRDGMYILQMTFKDGETSSSKFLKISE